MESLRVISILNWTITYPEQVCIMKDPTMLALAAEQFVGKPPNEIQDIILQVRICLNIGEIYTFLY